jgi:branched-chain amino acid aminotransferase
VHGTRRPASRSNSLETKVVRELASVDGVIRPTAEASIPLPDDGLYRGDGAFEVIRLYGGRPFALADHLDRIQRSAAAIDLPVDRAALEAEIAALLEAHGETDAQLRVVLTRGGRRVAAIEPLPDRGATLRLATVTYAPSVILTGVKSLSYGANMQATRIAEARGADEALLVRPDGIVLEAPTATIFWATADGALHTPAISTGILASITRAQVVRELDVSEAEYPIDAALSATEAFLASTTREVQPVTAIDDRELDAPGPRTRAAQEAFGRALDAALRAGAGR